MRISFDLDDTLICYQDDVPREAPLPWYLAIWGGNAPLRRGTRDLFLDLQSRSHEVWIYTTSSRTPWQIQAWLWAHGATIRGGIINRDRYEARMRRAHPDRAPGGYPLVFQIDLHVVDAEGTRLTEGGAGFRTLVLQRGDPDWARTVREEVARFGAQGSSDR